MSSKNRTHKDLTYLVKTTDEDGQTDHDEPLFGEREERIVEHGWKESEYGETTEKGARLACALREMVEDRFKWVDDYERRVEKCVEEDGVSSVVDEALEGF